MKKMPLHIAIFIGILAGLALGALFPAAVPYVKPLGSLFIRLLKMIVVPLIFVSIVDGIVRAGSTERLSRIGFKITAFYLTTNFLAVLTGLILVNGIRPGEGVTIFGTFEAARPLLFPLISYRPISSRPLPKAIPCR